MSNVLQYLCVVCDEECHEDTISCGNCEDWVHIACVPMSKDLLDQWSDSNMKFLCRNCCFTEDQFDLGKSLQRLQAVIGQTPREARMVTKCEALLLKTYGLQVPEVVEQAGNHDPDDISESILRQYHPAVLTEKYPAETTGDGNCFYRAVSRALTGTESVYVLLRVFTLLEILSYPTFYDSDHKKFVDLVSDNRIVVATYVQLARDVARIGAYADMMHMYALSAILRLPIRSYYPPQINPEFASEPYSRKVCGRGVNISEVPVCTIMWTSCAVPQGPNLIPNHFVPLFMRTPQTPEVIHIADSTRSDAEETTFIPCNDNHDSDQDDEHFCPFFENSSDDIHPLSNGCLDGGFLEIKDILKQLTSFNYDEAHDTIPNGEKNNVFFVVKNKTNAEKRQTGIRSNFSDDCGVYNSAKGSTPKTYLTTDTEGKLKVIYKKGDSFCYSKKVKGKKTFVPFENQSTLDSVHELTRNYSTLKKDSSFKRRVSWLGDSHIALVEYFGIFPGLSPHGNAKEETEYIRTPANVMSDMSKMLKCDNPLNVYNKLTLEHDVLSGPSSRRQVYDKKYKDQKKQRKEEIGHYISRGNIADHISEIDKMLADSNSIVKSIVRDHGKAPCIILYTDDQLEDIKNLCCSGQSILGIDKTFNLCNMHVTATCFKQTAVNMASTKQPPIFLGPLFIHDNSDFESFSVFFNHFRVKLISTDTNDLVFGTDEELALLNAITAAFPESGHLLCTRHLQKNVNQQLIDECIDKKARESLIEDIFGQDGLINADDAICFDVKCEEIEAKSMEISSKFHKYFSGRLKQNIQEQWETESPPGYLDKSWTNNNSESLNHVLKRAIDWKSQPLLDLVNIVKNLVDTQYKELLRSLVSMGQYRLSETHRHFHVSKSGWLSKTQEERQRLFKRLRRFVPKDKKTMTSTDGTTTVLKPRSLGKKIGQRKRKINERTTTFKKKKTNDE